MNESGRSKPLHRARSKCNRRPVATCPGFRRRAGIFVFASNRRGAVGIAFAILAPALILAAGIGIDVARLTAARAVLQSIADSAALKGVVSYDLHNDTGCGTSSSAAQAAAAGFVTAAAAQLTSLYNVSLSDSGINITATYNDSNCGANSTVSVALTAQIVHSLTSYFMGNFSLTATAGATNPNVKYTITVLQASNNSGSNDIDSFGYYPSTGLDGSAPDASSIFWFWTNSSLGGKVTSQTSRTNRSYMSTELLSFALDNVTDGRVPFSGSVGFPGYNGKNCYGSPAGTEHTFYSNMAPPNQGTGSYLPTDPPASCINGTESVTTATNNSFRTLTLDSTDTAAWASALLTGWALLPGVLPATPQGVSQPIAPYGTVSCAQLGSQQLDIAWNDMGTSTGVLNALGVLIDQLAYNSVYATVTCTGLITTATAPYLSQ